MIEDRVERIQKQIERTVDVSARYLRALESSGPMANWAKEHINGVKIAFDGYDQLVSTINSISEKSPILEMMPKTARLKTLLKGNDLPSVPQVFECNFAHGLFEARPRMLMGQAIKRGEIDSPTEEQKGYAIRTPSMDVPPGVLVVGTIGHLCERATFVWARKCGLKPDGGWKRDDWLEAMDEALMVLFAKGEYPLLYNFFVKPNSEQGLGWLNEEKVEKFKKRAELYLQNVSKFEFEGRILWADFKGTLVVKDGVECDEYNFSGDESKDLGIIRIQKGAYTPPQEVKIDHGRTIEGYCYGRGRFIVIREGERMVHDVGSGQEFSIDVKLKDLMQWQAGEASSLIVSEVCIPKYEEGRFENHPDRKI